MMATVTRLDPAPRAQVARVLVVVDNVKQFDGMIVDVRVEAGCTPAMTAAVSNAERK
jgi:hypothetical protein